MQPKFDLVRRVSRLNSGTLARRRSLWARESLFRGVTASPSIRLTNVMAVALLTSLLSRNGCGSADLSLISYLVLRCAGSVISSSNQHGYDFYNTYTRAAYIVP